MISTVKSTNISLNGFIWALLSCVHNLSSECSFIYLERCGESLSFVVCWSSIQEDKRAESNEDICAWPVNLMETAVWETDFRESAQLYSRVYGVYRMGWGSWEQNLIRIKWHDPIISLLE